MSVCGCLFAVRPSAHPDVEGVVGGDVGEVGPDVREDQRVVLAPLDRLRTHTHTHAHTHTHRTAHAQKHTHTYTHARARTHTHNTHTHAHARSRARAHTHTRNNESLTDPNGVRVMSP